MADETEKPETGAAAEASAEGGDGDAGAAPAKKKKMLLIVSSAVAVIGILVAVGVVFFMGGKEEPAEAPDAHAEGTPVAIYDVPEFNLSLLNEGPGTPHFMKIKVSLELAKATDAVTLGELLPRLQDDWGGLLRQMRVDDLQGSANLHRLKENLLRRAVQSLDPIEIKAVYIRELLVQ